MEPDLDAFVIKDIAELFDHVRQLDQAIALRAFRTRGASRPVLHGTLLDTSDLRDLLNCESTPSILHNLSVHRRTLWRRGHSRIATHFGTSFSA